MEIAIICPKFSIKMFRPSSPIKLVKRFQEASSEGRTGLSVSYEIPHGKTNLVFDYLSINKLVILKSSSDVEFSIDSFHLSFNHNRWD